jgi:hypothetical protein
MRLIFPVATSEKISEKSNQQANNPGGGKCRGRSETSRGVADCRISYEPAGVRQGEMRGIGFSAFGLVRVFG